MSVIVIRPHLSASQLIVLALQGWVYIGQIRKPGWSGSSSLYAWRCPDHGIVASTIEGHYNHRVCPECRNREAELELGQLS